MSNLLVGIIALAIVVCGGYYIIVMITPSERDEVVNQVHQQYDEYAPDSNSIKLIFESGVKSAKLLLNI